MVVLLPCHDDVAIRMTSQKHLIGSVSDIELLPCNARAATLLKNLTGETMQRSCEELFAF